jgi:aldehyde:ferredoxin oxidoreductase
MACTGCPVGCIHIGMFRREFDKGYEYEAVSVGYDYELIFSLGTFLGMRSARDVLELIEAVEIAGMDAISCGVALGWATEAFQTGLISTEQTLVSLSYGETFGYLKAISHLARGENKFYTDLAKGVKHASIVYGGVDFAMQIAGNEMPGYHTGYGSLIGALVGARHSHLCNAGYAFDQSQKFSAQTLADYLFEEEVERCLLNSLIICLFARKVYTRQRILDMFDSFGKTMTDADLTDTARRIYATKLRIKQKLGFDVKDITLPERFFKIPSMTGLLNHEVASEVVHRFCEKCTLLFDSKR